MGSPFDAAMRAADRALDGVFGEPFLVTPCSRGAAEDEDVNGPAQADPSRAPLQVVMTFQEAGKDYYPTARGVAANAAQRRTGAEITVSVLDRNLPWPPQAGDLLYRIKTGVTYRVTAVEPDDAGRIWLTVTVERPR